MTETRSLPRLLRLLALATALSAVVAVTALATMRRVLDAQEVLVPDLRGRRIADAGTLAGQQRLGLRVEGRRHDPRVEPGNVATQEPEAGATLKAGRSVKVWLSLGPRRITVPDVRGQTMRAARLALEQSGAPVARVLEAPGPAEEDVVMLQEPLPGPAEDLGRGASILVSRGPAGADYVMPDVIGKPGEDVIAALRSVGLSVTAVPGKLYPGAPAGAILKQTPPSGHRVSPRSVVTLELNGGVS